MHDHSFLLVSTSYFERKSIANLKLDAESENVMDRDMGFWVGLSSEGVWECVRSLLPVSVVPKSLQNDFIAMEVVMKNGKKHVIFRGLATVVNDSDVKLGISICHVSSIHGHNRSSGTSSFNIVPGASAVLPWRSTSKDSDECLLVRPCINHPEPPYSWGCAVAVGSGYAYGKDQSCIDQGSLYRQKQETKMPNFTFKLNQLEKKDILLRCSSTGSRQFWLSVGADASVLHTELNAPVYDWRISINSPLKLESRLPCPAEFTIWEKTKEGNCVERQHGIISSRRSVHICSADIQKSVMQDNNGEIG
jgi:vacuolar protein sorting-associated protein 13A/C